MKIEFKKIFDKTESTLIKQSWFSEKDFKKEYGVFKNFKKKNRSDNDFFYFWNKKSGASFVQITLKLTQ